MQKSPYTEQSILHLESGRILPAISLLQQEARRLRIPDLTDRLNQIENNYHYMLRFLAEGAKDPQREKMYSEMIYDLYSILRHLERVATPQDASSLYDSLARSLAYSELSFPDALGRFFSANTALQLAVTRDGKGDVSQEAKGILAERDRALRDIFAITFTLLPGDRKTLESIRSVITGSDQPYELRALLVAAITLSLIHTYDARKMEVLLDIESRTSDFRIQARALTGLVIALHLYSERLKENDYALRLRFEAWKDDLSAYAKLRDVISALVKVRGSGKLNERIQAEIMPGLSAFGADMMKKIKEEGKDLSLEELTENPDWQKIMESKGLDKKIRRMNELFNQGADMMLGMFPQLSGHFFFKDADVWFRPFSEAEALRLGLNSQLSDMLVEMPNFIAFCDVDKMALAINLSRMPASASSMMKNAMNVQKEQIDAEIKDREILSATAAFDMECVNYARILYRFFTFFRLHKEFNNPFAAPLDLSGLPYIGGMITTDEIFQMAGEAYYHQGFYNDAVNIYRSLRRSDRANSLTYLQKEGFCLEKSGDLQGALRAYHRASELTDTPDKWLLERIHHLYVQTDDMKMASRASRQLMNIDDSKDEYLINWLKETLSQNPYIWEGKDTTQSDSKAESSADQSDSVRRKILDELDKGIAKLNYLYPEEEITLRILIERAFQQCEWEKIVELSQPRLADIEMFAAAGSLAAADSSNIKTGEDSEERSVMISDIIPYLSAMVALDRMADAVEIMQLIRHLTDSNEKIDPTGLISKKWRDHPALQPLLYMIPLLYDASSI